MSKHTKFRSLMSILYALIMLLPLSSVGFRCAYTIFNKNAYESYYGETINEVIDVKVGNNSLEEGKTYYIGTYQYKSDMQNLTFSSINVDNVYYGDTLYNEVLILSFYNSGSEVTIYGRRTDLSEVFNRTLSQGLTIKFDYIGIYSNYSDYLIKNVFYYKEYNKFSYLDNAFEYSLHEFVGQNGRGVLNLTDWFTSVFLQSSTHTQLYLDFINWYMNYTLLVSCVYILYLVLMWFVSLARRLLTNMIEKGGDLK